MTIHPTACGAAILLALGIAVSLRGAVEPPATQNAAEKWDAVLRELGSASFPEREAGQNALKAAKVADLPTLQMMASRTDDPEIKARLEKRVEELQEDAMLNPPPITLELNKATVTEMLKGLGDTVGKQWQPLTPPFRGQRDAPRYTVAMKETSFVEVFAALMAQVGMRPMMQGRIQTWPGGWNKGVISRGFLFYATSVSYHASVPYEGVGQTPAQGLDLSYTMIADPRCRILSYDSALTSVIDSDGHELAVKRRGQSEFRRAEVGQWYFDCADELNDRAFGAPGRGKRIKTAKGVARFMVVVGVQKAEAPDMAKFVNKPISLGDLTIEWTRFDVRGRSVNQEVKVTSRKASKPGEDPRDASVDVQLIDATGKEIWSGAINGIGGGSFSGKPFIGPIKGVFSIVTKVKEVDVPFEFKNLALP